jgi:hypothetical protein
MFPNSWSSDRVAHCLIGMLCVAMLSTGLLVRVVRNSTKPLPAINGGKSGDLLKPKPSLPLPTGEQHL